MTNLNKNVFADGIMGLCELFDKTASKVLLGIYYEALKELTDEQFKQAVAHIVKTNKYNSMPKPAEILLFINGDGDASAIKALLDIEDAIRKHSAYPTLLFSDPIINAIIERVDYDGKRSWAALCAIPLDEFKWWKKDFDKIYKAFAHGNVPVSRPLVGLLGSDEVVFIGDKDKCLALMDESNKADSVMKRLEDVR